MAQAALALKGIWVHAIAAPESTAIQLAPNTERGEDWTSDASFVLLAGRSRPVAVVGDAATKSYHFEVLITDAAAWQAFSILVESKRALCVRDSSGRRVFGLIPSLNVTDEKWGAKRVTFDVVEIDYTEEL